MKKLIINKLNRYYLLVLVLISPLCLAAQDGELKIKLKLTEEDSTRNCYAQVTDANDKPAQGVSVNFYIKRSVGLLPIGSMESTDENGEASVEFPAKIPGDSLGNVTVIARLEDDDAILDKQTITWGMKTKFNTNVDQRSLWASRSNAPTYLIIASNTIILGIWGTVGYILYLLFFRIKKSGMEYNPKNRKKFISTNN